jgi:hypothetical protein
MGNETWINKGMTPKEFIATLKGFRNDLADNVEAILLVESEKLSKATVSKVKSGSKPDYSEFSPYSEKSGWKQKRDKAGLQTGHKDMFFTGKMLDSVKPDKSLTKKNKKVVTVFSGVDKSEEKKVLGLSQQENTSGIKHKYIDGEIYITDPSEEQYDKVYENVVNEISKLFYQYKLA